MAFIFYFIIILATAASVMFGLDLVSSPLPSTPNVPIGRVARSPPPAHIEQARNNAKAERNADDRALSPIYPASPIVPQSGAPQAATDATASQASSKEWLPPAPPLPAADASAQPDDKQAGTEIAGASPPAPGGAQCDLAACSAAYFSFRASDCTYQPYQGPRRLCTRGGGTVATAAPRRHRAVGRVAQRFAGPPGARDQRELDEVTRIVRKMTRGERGDIAVQDSQGRIIIVHPGSARAYSPYDDYDGGD